MKKVNHSRGNYEKKIVEPNKMIFPLVEKDQILKEFHKFKKQMAKEASVLEKNITYRPNRIKVDIYWHPSFHLWAYLRDPKPNENHYWFAFGTEDPTKRDYLHISCEINPPYEGINRKTAGLFVRDSAGRIYIAHDGVYRTPLKLDR